MIEIDDKIVSADLLRDCFACDLAACKGICCVEGNAGAPLETDEVDTLEEEYPNYKPYMTPEGIRAVEAQGFMVVDEDGDYTTPLVDDAECAYACTEEGITFCAIEKAFREGKTTFRKPISCHLYPIRLMRFSNGTIGGAEGSLQFTSSSSAAYAVDLSGPAVRPIALRMVWQAVGAVNIPVVGLGGIATGRDALEFIMAGATAVQVGAANFANPRAMETIADEMAAWMDKNGVKTLDEIRGCARNAE